MPAKAGICNIEGCGNPRRKGSAQCREHYNQKQREKLQAGRDWYKNGLVWLSGKPGSTRRCVICKQERANDFLFFNWFRDKPHESRYFCICRFCDRSALIDGITIEIFRESIARMRDASRWSVNSLRDAYDLRPFRLATDIADAFILSKGGRIKERGSWGDEFERYLDNYLGKS